MSQTLKQKKHRKLKKIAERNKAREGKEVVFTDRVGDAEKKRQRQDWSLIGKYQQQRQPTREYGW